MVPLGALEVREVATSETTEGEVLARCQFRLGAVSTNPFGPSGMVVSLETVHLEVHLVSGRGP